jgi:hypothetical protein
MAETSPQRERRWFLITDGWRPEDPGEVRLAGPGHSAGDVMTTTDEGGASASPHTCEWCSLAATHTVNVRGAISGKRRRGFVASGAIYAYACDDHPGDVGGVDAVDVLRGKAKGVDQLALEGGDDA